MDMDFELELQGHRRNLRALSDVEPYVTQKQVRSIAMLMGEVLPGRTDRINVLRLLAGEPMRAVTGVNIESTKNLTGKMASYLINQFKEPESELMELSDYGREFLIRAAAYTKTLA